jgi:rare lipoprotein A
MSVATAAVAAPPAASLAPAPYAAVPAANGAPQIFLQVGAYAERANADNAAAKISAGGVSHAFVLPVSEGARTLYKVRIGPLADVDSVDQLTTKLTGLGFNDAQIVIP